MNEDHFKPILICMRNTKETYNYILENEILVTDTTEFEDTATTSVIVSFIDKLDIESKLKVTKDEQ